MTQDIKRTYTVPLRRGYAETPRYRRTNKAVTVLRAFMVRHMKSENIKIGPKLNELLWQHGMKNPPGKVKVTATKDSEGVVRVELEGVNYVDFKQQEKTQKATTLKEKLQSKVADAKGGDKKKDSVQDADSQPAVKTPTIDKLKEEAKAKPKAEAKETKAKTQEAKEEKTKTETKEEANTADSKPKTLAEAVEPKPKAD